MIPLISISVSLIIVLLSGAVVVFSLWPKDRPYFSDIGIKLCLSIGAGLGFVSCHYFIGLVIFKNNGMIIFNELILLFILGCCHLAIHYKRIRERNVLFTELERRNSKLRSWFSISFGVIIFLSFLWFLLRSLNYPHGKSDAWGIWNMRAKFLFHAGDQLSTVFSNRYGWPHSDYPLMISSNVARLWQYSGGDFLSCPIVIAFIFTAAVLGLLYFSISAYRSSTQAILAIIVLLGIRYFIPVGSGQLADIPISFFVLSTCFLLCWYHSSNKKYSSYLLLAGFMAACAGWTKNEGLLFLLSVVLANLLVGFRYSKVFAAIRDIFIFSLGALPILTVLFIFKSGFAPPNDLMSSQNFEATIARLLDINRIHIVVISGFHYLAKALGAYIIILPLSLFVWGGALKENDHRGVLVAALTILLQVFGYAMAYITSPHDLYWHLSTSMSRLLMHLIPSMCFIFFMIINPPESNLNIFSDFLFKHK